MKLKVFLDLLYLEKWEKALSIFEEMEMNDIQPDSIACSSLMKAFNKGCQPARVLLLAELMKEKGIAFNETSIFEIISACSMYCTFLF